MASKKEFSEFTRSRLDDLYDCVDDIVEEKAKITLYGKTVTFEGLQKAILDQPFIETKMKYSTVDLSSISAIHVGAINNALNQIPKSRESAVMEVLKMVDNPKVTFYPAEMKNSEGRAKLFPPRMVIDVGSVPPRCGVRINTGYIIRMPIIAKGRRIKADSIELMTPSKQLDFVIIPQVNADEKDFVPALYTRDPEDTGLFTINFTSVSGKVGKIYVIFKAYKVKRPLNAVSLINSEQGTADVFKPKDSRSGRFVKNSKIKIQFDTFVVDNAGDLLLSTFNSTTKPKTPFENQKIKINKLTTIFTSRKREWFDPNLMTLSGVYTSDPKNTVAPKIAKGSDYNKNTHCLVFVESKLNLFSDKVFAKATNLKIINGSFINCENYKEVSKNIRQFIASLRGLSVGAKKCIDIAKNKGLSVDKLLALCDHHGGVSENDSGLIEKVQQDEKGMFNCKPVYANAYSVNMYAAFKYLLYVYCKDLFTEDQLNELRLTAIKSSENAKRPAENSNNEVPQAKLVKNK